MSNRQNFSSNTVWEKKYGYSRTVRIGNVIEIAGTTAVEGDNIIYPGNPFKQMCFIIEKIEKSLHQAGAKLKDVMRTRMYVTDIGNAEQIGQAHAKYFGEIKPVATMVQISGLINPDLLVEVEVTAIVSSSFTKVEI